MLYREEQFLRRYCKEHTKAEFNNLKIHGAASFKYDLASRNSKGARSEREFIEKRDSLYPAWVAGACLTQYDEERA